MGYLNGPYQMSRHAGMLEGYSWVDVCEFYLMYIVLDELICASYPIIAPIEFVPPTSIRQNFPRHNSTVPVPATATDTES